MEEDHVAGLGQAVDAAGHVDHRAIVAMGQHAALRQPRRARRVHEGKQVLLPDRRAGPRDRTGVAAQLAASLLAQLGQVVVGAVHREDALEVSEAGEAGNPLPLGGVLAHEHPRRGMGEHVGAIGRRRRLEDRDDDGAD